MVKPISNARRLPIYLLIDCSGSMTGEPISAMDMGLRALLADLRSDPLALDSVWLSVITFGTTAEQIVPLTELSSFESPDLESSGATALGDAFDLLAERIAAEVRTTTEDQKGDWKPMVFVFTDGEPTDNWVEPVDQFQASGRADVVVCGAGPDVVDATLKKIGGENTVRLDDTQPGTLSAFLKWVTMSIAAHSRSVGAVLSEEDLLEDLPEDEGIVLIP